MLLQWCTCLQSEMKSRMPMKFTSKIPWKRTGWNIIRPKANLKETYNCVIEEHLSSQLRKVEEAHVNCKHGESWSLINEITGRRSPAGGQLEGKSQQERVQNWYNHFKNLLGSPPDIDDEDEAIPTVFEKLNIKEGPFDYEEYREAKESLVEGKRCGEDGIAPEVLKRCDLDDIILEFCNQGVLEGKKPEQWSLLNIIPIPKSGDLSKAGNYLGISLSSIVAKIFNKMILCRIRSELDDHLRINQNGFRVGRTTVGHILALQRIIEGGKQTTNQLLLHHWLSEGVWHCSSWQDVKILRAYGIPNRIVGAIGTMYETPELKWSRQMEKLNHLTSQVVSYRETLWPRIFLW